MNDTNERNGNDCRRAKRIVFDRLVTYLAERERLGILYVLEHLDREGIGGLCFTDQEPTGEDVMDDFLGSLPEEVIEEICRKALPNLLIKQFGAEKVSIRWKPNRWL